MGGISASISAFESLHLRGYDLELILQFDESKYQNHDYLREYFTKKGVLSLALPPPPSPGKTADEDFELMSEYYSRTSSLDIVDETIALLAERHNARIESLEIMSGKAHQNIWYPFTQHKDVSPTTITTIDSASGDFFQTHSTSPSSSAQEEILTPTFDGSASWWTQGLGHGSPELSLAASYAAGRYGHVMFAGTVHEPALKLSQSLLRNLNNPRMSKVFFSDNGSTGMEVATKMALTASCARYGWSDPQAQSSVGVLGLKGSYHGDTIGAMDCSEPSIYNEKVHWYKGRGHWLDFPQVKMVKGVWRVQPPEGMEDSLGEIETFGSLSEVFDLKARSNSNSGRRYAGYIEETLKGLAQEDGMKFGALIMEVSSTVLATTNISGC